MPYPIIDLIRVECPSCKKIFWLAPQVVQDADRFCSEDCRKDAASLAFDPQLEVKNVVPKSEA